MTNIESLMLYIVVLGTASLCMALYENQKKQIRFVFFSLAIMLPVLLAAFRVDVGTDYVAYRGILKWSMDNTFLSVLTEYKMFEIGFRIIVKLVMLPQSMVIGWGILAFIPIVLVIHTLKTQYKGISLSVAYTVYLHLFYTASLNIVRQYIAVAIIFWGMKYIYQNKFWKFLGVVLVAMTIHRSAFIVLPLYFLWNHKKDKMAGTVKVSVISVVLCVLIVMWIPILNVAISSFSFLSKYRYLVQGNGGNNRDIFIKIVLLFMAILFYKYYKNKDKRMLLYVYALFISVVIGFTGFYTTFFKRISLYYEVPMIVLFGYLPTFFKSNSRLLVKIGIYVYAIGYFILSAYILGQSDLIPYNWR